MLIGRVLGWILVSSAVLLALGEAVMAFGTGTYNGITTSEAWIFFSGKTPAFLDGGSEGGLWAVIVAVAMAMPVWSICVATGLVLIFICGKKSRKGRLFVSR